MSLRFWAGQDLAQDLIRELFLFFYMIEVGDEEWSNLLKSNFSKIMVVVILFSQNFVQV